MTGAFGMLRLTGLYLAAMMLAIFSASQGHDGDNFWLDETDAGYWASHPADGELSVR